MPRRKSLLIGINYTGSDNELNGCHQDVDNVAEFLKYRGYQDTPQDQVVLRDDLDVEYAPTGHNILAAMDWLVSEEHTTCFFHYSGHGGQIDDPSGKRPSGLLDTIVPVNYQDNGMIDSDMLHKHLVSKLPPTSTLFLILDCCHSGSSLELPFVYRSDDDGNVHKLDGYQAGIALLEEAKDLVIGGSSLDREAQARDLYAGATSDEETSADAQINGVSEGAMSWAFLESTKNNPDPTYKEALHMTRALLKASEYTQVPQLCVGPINQHRYSILRAEADAVAQRMLIIANNNGNLSRASQLYETPHMNRLSGISVYELEANETSAVDQSPPFSELNELPVLPRISMISAFNPFDDLVSSPPSPVPDLLKPAIEAGSLATTASSSSGPPTNYLPFIAPTAPFDPYEEKYEDHPAGPYGAQKFKNRQTMSSAPFGFKRPVTPNFDNENSSRRFSDAGSSASSGDVATGVEHPSSSQTSYSPPRTPLFRPFKIPRKPLPPGAKPFPPVSYTPPGSPLRHDSLRDNTSPKVVNPVPQHPGRALLNATPIRSPPSNQSVERKPWPNLHKPLPPSPAPASMSQRQHPAPLGHRAGWEQEERRPSRPSDHGMQPSPPRSPEIIPRPVTAADRVRSDLRDVKDRFLDKWFKLRRF
ncbi:metacaspase, partial [Aureobasidium melanogenum]